MGSSLAGICRCLLLLGLSSSSLQTTATYDYQNRPRPVVNIEDGLGLRIGGRVENPRRGSNAAAAPLSAPSSAASAGSLQKFATLESNLDASLTGAVLPAAAAGTVYAAVEKNFSGASLGQVTSAAPEEPAPEEPAASPSDEAATEAERNKADTAKTEGAEGSRVGLGAHYAGEDEFIRSSVSDPDVSRLGAFYAPRPVLPGRVLFNQPICQTKDETQGVCHVNPMSCQLRSGSFSHSCAGGNGVCCVFRHSCTTVSQERVSHYQNPAFPLNSTGNLVCNYKVKIAPGICGIRADFLNYTTAITAGCTETQLMFLIGNDTRTVPVCGVLTGVSMMFEVTPDNDTEFVITHILGGKQPYMFNIRLAQVRCSAVKPIKESACGRRNVGLVRHKRAASLPSGSATSRESGESEVPFEAELKADLSADDQLTRVLGGRESRVAEWPWQAALFKRPSTTAKKASFFCGATLINSEYLLTAAHCVSRFKSFQHTDVRDHIIVALGDHDLTVKNESKSVYRKLKRVILHPLYDSSQNQYDIALLQLSSPVSYSGAIGPACLPVAPRSLEDEDLHISGWGVVSFNGSRRGPTSKVLRTVTVAGISRDACEQKWKKFDNPRTVYRDLSPIGERQGCADNTPGAACFGDSGGPVTFKEESGRFTLIGAISFGPPLCKIGGEFPTIYTRVAAYMNWIQLAVLDMF